MTIAQGMDDGVDQVAEGEGEGEGWQDPVEYARQQSIEVGDVAPTKMGMEQEGNEEGNELVHVEGPVAKKRKLGNGAGGGVDARDIRARKEAKKLKIKEEKKKRAAEKLRQGSGES